MRLSFSQICAWAGAKAWDEPGADVVADPVASGYSIDSRTIQPGDLFFAVRGEHFDGHDFVVSALERGAVGAIIAESKKVQFSKIEHRDRLLVVGDTLTAMQRLAASMRVHWGKRVIGVTGSAGKTTTKEAIACALESQYRVHKSAGNLNNHFGLPLELLKLEPEHDFAVLEMGMSHAGEITALTAIASPNWGVVTNVGMAHAENFPDGQTGVARAKYELVGGLPSSGIAFLNADDAIVRQFGQGFMGRAIYFGAGEWAEVRAEKITSMGAEGIRFTARAGDEHADVRLQLLGEHNVLNALAGIAVGVAAGIPLAVCADALKALVPTGRRGRVRQVRGATILDDCYNSNPAALQAMVGVLGTLAAKRRIVVAGEMLELGPEGLRLHYECGEFMGRHGVDVVVGVRGQALSIAAGAKAAGASSLFVETPEDAGVWLRENLRAGDAVLLKGSRGVRLERALEILEQEA